MAEPQPTPKMDPNSLWREEVFTDRKIGTIRRLIPVKPDGTVDVGRKTLFLGEAALMTPAGQLPLTFEIPAENLEQAVAAYSAGLEKAYVETLEELEQLRRRASSQIVIPKGGLPSGLPPQGPGPGRLKL
ncbi:MAG: hypothetical protein HY553_10140 [Elusimicrobia bacterium]|nr:hypothetical protein [Elusimicrobiota bacterium]